MKRTKRLLFLSFLLAIMSSMAEAQTNGMTNGHYWVDLGLPSGTLWATCNVGANNPWEYGDYFAWGETEPKSEYSWGTYKYSKDATELLTKYCSDSSYGYNGYVDDLLELEDCDDAATTNWGSHWQMPSIAQIQELQDNTTTYWTTISGVNGRLFTGSNGNSIFLPATGHYSNTTLWSVANYGMYWSRTYRRLYDLPGGEACYQYVDSKYNSWSWSTRCSGCTIRPVCVQSNPTPVTTCPDNHHPHTIDLGLPSGTKWRCCNVGASTPEGYGDYFAWGETYSKYDYLYNWDYYSHAFYNPEYYAAPYLYSYCLSYDFGDVDNKTELDANNDAATAKCGSEWQMPSVEQIHELNNSDYTTKGWITQNGVDGYIIISKINGCCIFLPAAGFKGENGLEEQNSSGNFWSRSLDESNNYCAYELSIYSGYSYAISYPRAYGLSVRPVRKQSAETDNMTMDEAAAYLQSKGVLDSGDPKLTDDLLRQQLAKIAFLGVYSIKGRTVPTSVPSDNFPTIYTDLTNSSAYYYQAARAMLYLEYGDGVAPFDRNRLKFAPGDSIARVHALKVLMEAFNIQPDMTSTTNPFPGDSNVAALMQSNPRLVGYIRKAAALGIITTANAEFHPFTYCTRGQAFLMLARIMKRVDAGNITDPNPSEADYFTPLNTTLATISLGASLPMGNFQHYTKTSFAMDGVVPLVFAHTYNSYNTTLPEVFFGINNDGETYQPLGDGWSHNFHTYITVPGGITSTDPSLAVHWGGGSIDIYKPSGSGFVPVSYGVYDEMSLVGNELVIKTKSQMEYHFAGQGGSNGADIYYLSSVKDRNGNTLTISYETVVKGMPRIKSVVDSYSNRSLSFSYLSDTNLLTEVHDPIGRSINFGYELNSNTGRYQLTSFKDAKNQTTTYIYGDATKLGTSKLLTKIQLPKGNYIENQYDNNHRLTKTENGTSTTTVSANTIYGSFGATASTSSTINIARQGSTSATYNVAYNGNNVMTSMSGPQNFSVSSTYNDNSSQPWLPTAVTTNSTNISNIEYDDKGNILRMDVTGDGQTLTTTMTYDSKNNLTSVTDPNNNTTTYNYDSKGNLTGISAPEGVTTSIAVNSKGLPTSITNPMNVVTQFEYNSYGNLTKTKLPALGLTTSSTYDGASRLTSSTDALGRTTSFEYDNNDNLTSETDPDNHPTNYGYDANDNLTDITNAKGGVTTMTYDYVTDWLTSVSFAGATKEYDYNKDGTLNSFTKPDGNKLNYSYDNLGRVTDDGINTYGYDSKLRLKSVTSKTSNKTLSFTYDSFNRITGTSYNGHSNSYNYDANGNCTSINNTSYSYDKLNRLTSVSFNDKTITYTYRKDSQLSKVTYPNGMTTNYGYDTVGRLTSKKTKLSNGTVVASYTFELDDVGNIVSQSKQEPYSDIVMANEETTYSYNSSNRITQAGDISFEFDENGNTTWRGSEQYQWDKSDRLTKAGSTSLTYNPLGLIASYGNITFTTDPLGIGNVLSDSEGTEYIYGNGLEARVKNGNISYYVTDVRGSVVAIVNENGNVTHKYQYDDFGKVTQKEEADYNPFQYVGKYGVMALGDHLYYMRARHYDPTIGRFLSEDPIWSTNLYPYADNNPIMGIDPMGTYTYSHDFAFWFWEDEQIYELYVPDDYSSDVTYLYNGQSITYEELPSKVKKKFNYIMSNIKYYSYEGKNVLGNEVWYKIVDGEKKKITKGKVPDSIRDILLNEYKYKREQSNDCTITGGNSWGILSTSIDCSPSSVSNQTNGGLKTLP